jgi:NhaP-type Na+/H+ or K+/H+ antiporter
MKKETSTTISCESNPPRPEGTYDTKPPTALILILLFTAGAMIGGTAWLCHVYPKTMLAIGTVIAIVIIVALVVSVIWSLFSDLFDED